MDGAKKAAPALQPSKNRVIKVNRTTGAARWNAAILRGLETALRKDPEADLTKMLPPRYLEKPESFQTPPPGPQSTKTPRPFPNGDIRPRLRRARVCTVVSDLSADLQALLGDYQDLSGAITELLDESEVLYTFAPSCMVFRVSEGIAVKVTVEEYITHEYHALAYLQEHLPDFPAPKLHGMVRLDGLGLLFSSFVPGLDLEKVWPKLGDPEKRSISTQLDALLGQLRSLPFPPNTPLGGAHGQGCKDGRRFVRVSSEPIMDVKQFEDFIFAGGRAALPIYIQFLRDLLPASPTAVVFTHGDIRPANIMVDKDKGGSWTVVAIIDWDFSGFYPEYWECIKMTNNLSCVERSDWYRYLPDSLSHQHYPRHWLVDKVMGSEHGEQLADQASGYRARHACRLSPPRPPRPQYSVAGLNNPQSSTG